MKYSLNINQAAALNAGLPLNVCDILIFDFIKDFFSSTFAFWQRGSDGANYCYLSHSLIVAQLPLLGMSERSIRRHCAALCACGVLKKDPESKKPMYRQGDNFNLLIYSADNSISGQNRPINRTNETHKPDNSATDNRTNLSDKPDKSGQVTGQICPDYRTPVSNYNNIYYNNINIKEKKKEAVLKFIEVEKLKISGDEFWNYYESRNWISGSGQKIENWQALARAWHSRAIRNEIPRTAGQIGRTRKLKFYTYSDVCNEVYARTHPQTDFLCTSKKCNNSYLYILGTDYALLSDDQKKEFEILRRK